MADVPLLPFAPEVCPEVFPLGSKTSPRQPLSLANLRPSASRKLSYLSRPLACAVACAPSGRGGVAVSQARM